jgi:hypothetical protein
VPYGLRAALVIALMLLAGACAAPASAPTIGSASATSPDVTPAGTGTTPSAPPASGVAASLTAWGTRSGDTGYQNVDASIALTNMGATPTAPFVWPPAIALTISEGRSYAALTSPRNEFQVPPLPPHLPVCVIRGYNAANSRNDQWGFDVAFLSVPAAGHPDAIVLGDLGSVTLAGVPQTPDPELCPTADLSTLPASIESGTEGSGGGPTFTVTATGPARFRAAPADSCPPEGCAGDWIIPFKVTNGRPLDPIRIVIAGISDNGVLNFTDSGVSDECGTSSYGLQSVINLGPGESKEGTRCLLADRTTGAHLGALFVYEVGPDADYLRIFSGVPLGAFGLMRLPDGGDPTK